MLSQKIPRKVHLDSDGRDTSKTGNSDAVKSTVMLSCIKIERFYMAEAFTNMSTDKWRICKK